MNADGMNKNKGESEESKPPADMLKPWYKKPGILIMGLIVLIFWYMFYRPIEVTRGPWQVLDPGKPVEPLKFEVMEEGTGTVVEVGDLVQISRWHWSPEEERIEQRDDDWWIWIGFRTEKETPFYSINPRLLSAFVGLKEGG
jgi:hypothetical protein